MFPTKIILEKELKEKDKLQRMKLFEDERKKRIFCAKQRMIGIDKKGLEKQLQEKKIEKDAEKKIEDKQYRNIINAIAEADKLEHEILEGRRRINKEINRFRKEYQMKTHENLDGNLKQQEAGVSSGLIFDGEDCNAKNRKILQMQQQKCWLLQQISEKNQISKEKSFAENIYGDCFRARESRAVAIENLEKECRRQAEIAVKKYNEALAREQEFRKSLNSKKEQEDMKIEIRNAMTSDLLTENTEVSQSNLGSKKVIQYHYKGMSKREQQEIRKIQMEQIKERQVMINAENSYNKQWDNFYKQMDSLSILNEELRKKEKNNENRILMEKNKLFSTNMKTRNLQRKREEASNYSTPEFLTRFNKTSR